MAEVYAYGEGRVVKLDRPEWSGVSVFESDMLHRLADAGLPVARSHGVVTLEDRCGVVLDRIDGPALDRVIAGADRVDELDELARRFAELQERINRTVLEGLPDLVTRLGQEFTLVGLEENLVRELTGVLTGLDDGARGVCHFDFHPQNVIVAAQGWVVIDWLGVAGGPPAADLARTLVLWGMRSDEPFAAFLQKVRREALALRNVDEAVLHAWIRVVAAARLAEGFEGDYADWLRALATGAIRL